MTPSWYGNNFQIRITNLATPAIVDQTPVNIVLQPPSTGSTSPGNTGPPGNSGTVGVTVNPPAAKCNASEQLSADTYLKYNANSSAAFFRNFLVTYDTAICYVTKGQLAKDHYLDYAAGKGVQFHGMSVATFANGYVAEGQLASNHYLEYAAGKGTTFHSVGITTFRTGGYVKSGYLANNTTLTYASGKTQLVPALSFVTFDNSGNLVSFTPPSVQINP